MAEDPIVRALLRAFEAADMVAVQRKKANNHGAVLPVVKITLPLSIGKIAPPVNGDKGRRKSRSRRSQRGNK